MRGQYQYIDLGELEFHTVGEGFSDGDVSASDYTGRHQVELREHNASVAVIYQF